MWKPIRRPDIKASGFRKTTTPTVQWFAEVYVASKPSFLAFQVCSTLLALLAGYCECNDAFFLSASTSTNASIHDRPLFQVRLNFCCVSFWLKVWAILLFCRGVAWSTLVHPHPWSPSLAPLLLRDVTRHKARLQWFDALRGRRVVAAGREGGGTGEENTLRQQTEDGSHLQLWHCQAWQG